MGRSAMAGATTPAIPWMRIRIKGSLELEDDACLRSEVVSPAPKRVIGQIVDLHNANRDALAYVGVKPTAHRKRKPGPCVDPRNLRVSASQQHMRERRSVIGPRRESRPKQESVLL